MTHHKVKSWMPMVVMNEWMNTHFILDDNNKKLLKIDNITSEHEVEEKSNAAWPSLSDSRHLFDAARLKFLNFILLKFSPAFGKGGFAEGSQIAAQHTNPFVVCVQHTCLCMYARILDYELKI